MNIPYIQYLGVKGMLRGDIVFGHFVTSVDWTGKWRVGHCVCFNDDSAYI